MLIEPLKELVQVIDVPRAVTDRQCVSKEIGSSCEKPFGRAFSATHTPVASNAGSNPFAMCLPTKRTPSVPRLPGASGNRNERPPKAFDVTLSIGRCQAKGDDKSKKEISRQAGFLSIETSAMKL